MNIMDTLYKVVMWVIGIIVGLLFLVGIIALLSSLGNSASHRYWIKAGEYTYYTDAYEEKDGCITFINEYGSEMKQCGFYAITDKGQK